MMGCLLLLVPLLAAAASVEEQFRDFTVRYNRTFASEDERAYRLEVFRSSLDTIESLNMLEGGARFGVNKFADLTPAEFRSLYLGHSNKPHATFTRPETPRALPDKFDWRDKGAVTPVKDQGQCGSCWAFSAVENIESMWILARNRTLLLSVQQVVDCDRGSNGCGGGEPGTAYESVIESGGIESENSYPYRARDETCKFNKQQVVATISSWKSANSRLSEAELWNNLFNWGPISVCVDAAHWQHYTSGVMNALQCGELRMLDHCVLLVGWDTTGSVPYWIVRNSWATDWGVRGYIHLEMNSGLNWDTCGILQQTQTAVI